MIRFVICTGGQTIKSLSIRRDRSQDHTCVRGLIIPFPRRAQPAIPRDNSNINTALLPHIKQNNATEMFQKKPLIIGNMKVLSVIALGVCSLGVVTFKSVASLPKLKPTTAAAYNWQQFLPGGKLLNFTSLLTVSVLLV
jgi:hypothetical protein